MTDDLDFLAQLDAEISKVTVKSKLEAQKKAALKLTNNARATLPSRQRAREELIEIEKLLSAIIWSPVASVALFAEQTCSYCASKHRMFLQHMQREVSGKVAPTTRWRRINRPEPGLPREVLIQKSTTHMCVDCCSDFEFSFASGEVKFLDELPFTTSPSYHQEEVDGPLEED